MAKKKLAAIVKIQIPAGQATPAPPVGTALGPHGINIMDFCKAYNAATENQRGMVIPAEISIFEDRSFTFVTKTPPTPFLLRQAAGIEKGAANPRTDKAGKVTKRAGAPDRRDQDARPQRHRPRRCHRPGGRHRPLDGHRDQRLAPPEHADRGPRRPDGPRRRTPGTTEGARSKERAHDKHGKKYADALPHATTASSCTRRPRRIELVKSTRPPASSTRRSRPRSASASTPARPTR